MTGSTRREAVRTGVAGAGVIAGAAAIPALMRAASAFAQTGGDAAVLEAAIALEQTAVTAYDSAHGSGLLEQGLLPLMRRIRDQEQEHADALSEALEDIGGTPPRPPGASEVEGLGSLRSREALLRFAIELEEMAVGAYLDAHTRLQSPALLRTVTQIMANEGQHLVVLRQALGASLADSVPSAFEAGSATG